MSEDWISTRAKIAGYRRQNPDADVSDLQQKMREQHTVSKIRQLTEKLEPAAIARVMREVNGNEKG